MHVLVIGATGFVGNRLVDHFLSRKTEVTGIGRKPTHRRQAAKGFTYIQADTTTAGTWQQTVAVADVIINLAGQTIFHYWTPKYKEKIYASRIITTRRVVDALPENSGGLLLNASAIGYYGNRGDDELTEEQQAGRDFLAKVAADWEQTAFSASKTGRRVVAMRFGVILGRQGGALAKMLPAFKFYMGGPLGDGKQWFAWIHIEDLVRAIDFIIENETVKGAVNFCAPNPVYQRRFAKALGRALGKPAILPAPAFIVRTVMGELGRTLLAGQRALPRKLLENGFRFNYPEIDSALADLVSRNQT